MRRVLRIVEGVARAEIHPVPERRVGQDVSVLAQRHFGYLVLIGIAQPGSAVLVPEDPSLGEVRGAGREGWLVGLVGVVDPSVGDIEYAEVLGHEC